MLAEDGTTPLAGIYADAYEPDGYGGWQWSGYGETDASGAYQVGGLATGDYRLQFSDSVAPAQYATETYDDKPDLATGDDIHVELGLDTEGIDAILSPASMTFAIDLVTGWNLISLSLDPSSPEPSDALTSISGDYDSAWAYDGCDTADPWKVFSPSVPPEFNDMESMDERQGYWLEMAGPAQLQATGVRPLETSIALCPGWNLVGYPSGVARPVTEVLAGIAGTFNMVYG